MTKTWLTVGRKRAADGYELESEYSTTMALIHAPEQRLPGTRTPPPSPSGKTPTSASPPSIASR